jgi:hypothetical protein
MPLPTIRPAADPLDEIDRTAPVDSSMGRQDRADLPGERSDEPNAGDAKDRYLDATREVAQNADTDGAALDDHEGSRVPLEGDDAADLGLARDILQPAEAGLGADDDDPIDETERAGDDAIP